MTRRETIRRMRLWTGLALFAYATTHLLNHTAGLVSVEAMQAVLQVQQAIWATPPGLAVLYGSLAVHATLSLWGVYARRDLALRRGEIWQLVLGLATPPLLVAHIAGTRGVESALGAETEYPGILLIYFELAPIQGWRQLLALLAVWGHGCLGIYLWLRFKDWFPRWQMALFAAALLVPTLALAGVWSAGMRALDAYAEGEAPYTQERVEAVADPRKLAFVSTVERGALIGYGAALLALVGARAARRGRERLRGVVALTYPDGRRVRVPRGTTILEASRDAGIPHASLCGGRGRCSTCRTRIGAGIERLPEPGPAEAKVLARIGAPPNVRLACQTRPEHDLEVQPLLPPNVTAREARSRPGYLQGQEREVVVLFADLRGFTKLAESRLPFDVVFLLNRYFRTTGEAVERHGGRVDKFIGDGVMALFGLDEERADIAAAARAALHAAQEMAAGLAEIDRLLDTDDHDRLRLGIGIHLGPAIVGEMGWGSAVSVTAVGDTVNTASRLEQATKDFGAELVVSADLVERAGLSPQGAERRQVALRGRSQPLDVLVYGEARKAQVPEAAA
jgi:adenylate cyclase